MASLSELETKFMKADRAGDSRSASIFASEIKKIRAAQTPEPYSIGKEAFKSLGAGTVQPVLTTVAGLAEVSGTMMDTGVSTTIPASPYQAYNFMPMQSQATRDMAGTGEALDYSQNLRDFARDFPTKVANVDPRFIENHPFLYGSMSAIGQILPNIATGGTTIVPQLYTEYLMEAENRLGKPRNTWTQEERSSVDMNSLPYLALATTLEFVGLKGVGGDAVQAFLRGEKIPAEVLQRAYRSVGGGLKEGSTEYGQQVALEISQIIADLDPNEEIDLDTFFGKDKAVAFVSGPAEAMAPTACVARAGIAASTWRSHAQRRTFC